MKAIAIPTENSKAKRRFCFESSVHFGEIET